MSRNTFWVTTRIYPRTLVFNTFLCNQFFSMNEIDFASYPDDNTPNVTGDDIEDVINSTENVSIKLFKWFAENQLKANKDKSRLLLSGSEMITINVGGNIIEKGICEKLVGVYHKQKFNKHIDSFLK